MADKIGKINIQYERKVFCFFFFGGLRSEKKVCWTRIIHKPGVRLQKENQIRSLLFIFNLLYLNNVDVYFSTAIGIRRILTGNFLFEHKFQQIKANLKKKVLQVNYNGCHTFAYYKITPVSVHTTRLTYLVCFV